MYTCGPYLGEQDRQKMWEIVERCHNERADPGKFTCAFETSEDGYKHMHLAVGFKGETKPSMGLIKTLKGLCEVDDAGRKPNCQGNYVPKGDKESAKVGPYEILRRYLTDPHKKKTTDDGCIEFVPVVKKAPPPRPIGTKEDFWWKLQYEFLPNLALVKEGKKPSKRQRQK